MSSSKPKQPAAYGAERFTLDAEQLGGFMEREHGHRLALDESHETGGLAGSISGRILEANDAGAITGPDGFEVHALSCNDGDLMIAVASPSGWACLAPIHPKHIPYRPAGTFDACRETLEWVLERASGLIGQLRSAACFQSSASTGADMTLLGRVACELLSERLEHERESQDPQLRTSDEQLERYVLLYALLLTNRLHQAVAAFDAERQPLPFRSGEIAPRITGAQCQWLLDTRTKLAQSGGEVREIRAAADFVGVTLGGVRRDGGGVDVLLAPNADAAPVAVAVPAGEPVSWEQIEAQHAREAAGSADAAED